jgi:23S rRNA (uracil1939-C5)-methyltransferase
MTIELEITGLAAGGDGVGRDPQGRVTFVPRAAPGDRVRATIVKETASFARAELVEVAVASGSRVVPRCEYFLAGCGGCQWQHVARDAQLAAKQAIVVNALRNIAGLEIESIAAPAPELGWRRRARFHVLGGKVGLYANASKRIIPIAHCPQLEPALDAALGVVAGSTPPDGELAFVRGYHGEIVVGAERAWRGARALVGKAGIAGVVAGNDAIGKTIVEIEPNLYGGPWDFAQASDDGNRALVERARAALGTGPGRLLELYAGAGNFTRGFIADGWDVVATDAARPARSIEGARFEAGAVEWVLGKLDGPFDAIALDPPRTGAAEAIDGVVKHAPKMIVYVSCDPATLARDLARLVTAGYRAERAWPLDIMPQTAHVEVVVRLSKS